MPDPLRHCPLTSVCACVCLRRAAPLRPSSSSAVLPLPPSRRWQRWQRRRRSPNWITPVPSTSVLLSPTLPSARSTTASISCVSTNQHNTSATMPTHPHVSVRRSFPPPTTTTRSRQSPASSCAVAPAAWACVPSAGTCLVAPNQCAPTRCCHHASRSPRARAPPPLHDVAPILL